MRDIDIKDLIREKIFSKIKERDPDSFLVKEMEVCQGDARIDVAVINGKLTGYEIKSSFDDFRRLPNQVKLYSRVFDIISVVVTKNHLKNIQEFIPDWWGILTISDDNSDIQLIREAKNNPSIDAHSIATMLWRDEALTVLSENGLDKGLRSKPKHILWNKIASSFPLEELKFIVRNKLKSRVNWISDQQQMSDGELSQLFSM